MISVLIFTYSQYPVPKKAIQRYISEILKKYFSSKRNVVVEIVFVGDRKMRTFNKKYRQIDKTTPVLSFPMQDKHEEKIAFVQPALNVINLGSMVISYPQMIKLASQENKLVKVKIFELIEHGLNTLLGRIKY